MKTIYLIGAAALAAMTAPAVAQDTVAVDASGNVYVLTPAQEAILTSWPTERVTMYRAWPYNLQEFYWTMEPKYQDAWWMLDDNQRVAVYAMTPEQRVAAYDAYHASMGHGNMTSATATASAKMASDMGPRFVSRAVVQTTPAAATANVAAGDLPVCKKNQQDGCINSWDKNRKGNRELPYWPGKPASEMPGKKRM